MQALSQMSYEPEEKLRGRLARRLAEPDKDPGPTCHHRHAFESLAAVARHVPLTRVD